MNTIHEFLNNWSALKTYDSVSHTSLLVSKAGCFPIYSFHCPLSMHINSVFKSIQIWNRLNFWVIHLDSRRIFEQVHNCSLFRMQYNNRSIIVTQEKKTRARGRKGFAQKRLPISLLVNSVNRLSFLTNCR